MANRASGRRAHGAERSDQFVVQPGSFVGDDPGIHGQAAHRVIAARQRQNAGAVF
jgi:hypothetical protein